MSQSIVITVRIDIPSGATVTVGGAPDLEDAPWPGETQQQAAPSAPQTAPAPPQVVKCPYHDRELQSGKYGLFCSGKGGNGPVNAKGYCDWRPDR